MASRVVAYAAVAVVVGTCIAMSPVAFMSSLAMGMSVACLIDGYMEG